MDSFNEVVSKLTSLEAALQPITDFLSNEENVKLLKQDKTQNMAFLQKEFNIGACAVACSGWQLGAGGQAGGQQATSSGCVCRGRWAAAC